MIDVIIPAYNAHKTIGRTLLSLASQSEKDNLNVVIVNDGSNQDYSKEVKEYSKYLNIKELKVSKNKGPGYARQYGLDKTDNEYVMFIDSDDVLFSYYSIFFLKNKMQETNCDIVFSSIYNQDQNEFRVLDQDYLTVRGKLYKRKYLKDHNISFPELYVEEETSFNNQCYSYGAYYETIGEITYVKLYNENSSKQDYLVKYDEYFSEGNLFTLNKLIDNKARDNFIAKYSFYGIVYLFNRISVLYHNVYDNEIVLDNLKKIIAIYNKYKNQLDYNDMKDTVESFGFNYIDYICDNGLLTINQFIEKYK